MHTHNPQCCSQAVHFVSVVHRWYTLSNITLSDKTFVAFHQYLIYCHTNSTTVFSISSTIISVEFHVAWFSSNGLFERVICFWICQAIWTINNMLTTPLLKPVLAKRYQAYVMVYWIQYLISDNILDMGIFHPPWGCLTDFIVFLSQKSGWVKKLLCIMNLMHVATKLKFSEILLLGVFLCPTLSQVSFIFAIREFNHSSKCSVTVSQYMQWGIWY